MFDDLIKIAENEQAIFYVNSMTKGVEDYAKRNAKDNKVDLGNLKCLLAESKETGAKEYVLIQNNEYIFATHGYEDVGCHIDMMILDAQLEE